MKRRSIKFREREPVIGIAVLFLLGILAGFLFVRLLQSTLGEDAAGIDEGYLRQIASTKPGLDLFMYTIWKELKGIAVFFLLALTWLALPYMAGILLRQGFLLGFLATSMLGKYQWKGLLLVLSYYFPQLIIEIPLWLYCFGIGWLAWQEGKTAKAADSSGLHRMSLLHLDGKKIMLVMAGCFLQSAAETWAGTWLLQKAVRFLLQ